MLQWLLINFMAVVVIADVDLAADSPYASSLRYNSQPATDSLNIDTRTSAKLAEDIDENVIPHFELNILVVNYTVNRNLGWYTEDVVEYSKRLRASLDQITQTPRPLPSNQQNFGNNQLALYQRKFNTSARTFDGLIHVLTNLNKQISLKRRMIELANYINSQMVLRALENEIEELEKILERAVSAVFGDISRYFGGAINQEQTSAKLYQVKNQLVSIISLSSRLDTTKKEAIKNIKNFQKQFEKVYVSDMEARKKKFLDLYEQNRNNMESIVSIFEIVGNPAGSSSFGQMFESLVSNEDLTSQLISSLEEGYLWQQKYLTIEMVKGSALQQTLTQAINGYRKDLSSNDAGYSDFYTEARRIANTASISSKHFDVKQLKGQLDSYNDVLRQLTDKIQSFNSIPKDALHVDFARCGQLIRKNKKAVASLNSLAKQIETARETLAAIKFGSVQLTESFYSFTTRLPSLISTAVANTEPRITATHDLLDELQNSIEQLSQRVIAQPLRRTLQNFILSENDAKTKRRKIFDYSKPFNSRSNVRERAGPVQSLPLSVSESEGLTIQHF